jgi:predicted nucleic acid-binding protein
LWLSQKEGGFSGTQCAVAAKASAIVTGDKHLLALKAYEGIGIMTVADLLRTFPQTP